MRNTIKATITATQNTDTTTITASVMGIIVLTLLFYGLSMTDPLLT